MSSPRPTFQELFLGCLDRALGIVGTGGRDLVLESLESVYGIGPNQIPDHPDLLIKTLTTCLPGSAKAVENEMLSRMREVSGVGADNFLEAVEELRQQSAASELKAGAQPIPTPQARWQLESQSGMLGSTGQEGDGSFRYSARFSFGLPPQRRQEDPESREALEAYLRSIVEKHAREKRRESLE